MAYLAAKDSSADGFVVVEGRVRSLVTFVTGLIEEASFTIFAKHRLVGGHSTCDCTKTLALIAMISRGDMSLLIFWKVAITLLTIETVLPIAKGG